VLSLLLVNPPSSLPCDLVSSFSFLQLVLAVLLGLVVLDTVTVLEQPYVQFENAENVGKISQNLAGKMDDIK